MTGDERSQIDKLGPAPAPGHEAQAALDRALIVARELGERVAAGSPREFDPAAWEAFKAPALMARDALLTHSGEKIAEEKTRAASALALQLADFDWAAWSTGLSCVGEPPRRTLKAAELEELLFKCVEESFHDMQMQSHAATSDKASDSASAAKNPQSGVAAQAAPLSEEESSRKINLAKKLILGIGSQEWGDPESIHSFDRQRAMEPFAKKEGWPWSEARAEAMEGAGLWRAADPAQNSCMKRAWEDRADGLWPTPFDDINAALLQINVAHIANKGGDESHQMHSVAYMIARAIDKKTPAQSLAEISAFAEKNGMPLSERNDALWAQIIIKFADRGELSALEWAFQEARKSQASESELRRAVMRGQREGQDNALALDESGALVKWIREFSKKERSDEEHDRGMALLLSVFESPEKPAVEMAAVATALRSMANGGLIERDQERYSDALPMIRHTMRIAKRALGNGANVDAANSRTGETALMGAAWSKNTELAMFLLSKGANSQTKSIEGKSALDFADEDRGFHQSLAEWADMFRAQADGWGIKRELAAAALSDGSGDPQGERRLSRRI